MLCNFRWEEKQQMLFKKTCTVVKLLSTIENVKVGLKFIAIKFSNFSWSFRYKILKQSNEILMRHYAKAYLLF